MFSTINEHYRFLNFDIQDNRVRSHLQTASTRFTSPGLRLSETKARVRMPDLTLFYFFYFVFLVPVFFTI